MVAVIAIVVARASRVASSFAMAETQFFVGVHGVISNRGRIVVLRRAGRMPWRPSPWDLSAINGNRGR